MGANNGEACAHCLPQDMMEVAATQFSGIVPPEANSKEKEKAKLISAIGQRNSVVTLSMLVTLKQIQI